MRNAWLHILPVTYTQMSADAGCIWLYIVTVL